VTAGRHAAPDGTDAPAARSERGFPAGRRPTNGDATAEEPAGALQQERANGSGPLVRDARQRAEAAEQRAASLERTLEMVRTRHAALLEERRTLITARQEAGQATEMAESLRRDLERIRAERDQLLAERAAAIEQLRSRGAAALEDLPAEAAPPAEPPAEPPPPPSSHRRRGLFRRRKPPEDQSSMWR
jgi:chromosome segregation ATPase